MGWTAPRTWVVGEVVTAAQMNEQVRDNELYLKGETDKLDDVSQTYAGGTKTLDTIYQNSTKIRLVGITITVTTDAQEYVRVLVGSGTPPTTEIMYIGAIAANSGGGYWPGTFIVLPNYYYKIEVAVGTPTIGNWYEWDLH
jgi:hypothetical protein